MTVHTIARMGNPILYNKAKKVDNPMSADVLRIVEDMIATMYAAPGTGLAAPQIQVPLRILIFYVSEERLAREGEREEEPIPLTVLINPEIEIVSKQTTHGWEGCLSLPGLVGYVPRPTRIRYSGVDPQGNLIEREAKGFHARVVQHEYDHLDGILYPQRMDDIKRLLFTSEWAFDPDAPAYIKDMSQQEDKEEDDILSVWKELERGG